MPFGYNGKILHVNLNTRKLEVKEPQELFYRRYMGGGGFAAYYLLNEMPAGSDPLGPDNVLIFACSVVTGAPIAGLSRYTVAAKSPLTGGFMESEAGGYFGPELKFSGFDAIIIKGRADSPCYLWINNGKVEIRDASNIWGLDNGQTRDELVKELGDNKIRVASIGPAGEHQVLIACIINELNHTNGRGGMGAVMGSKYLKAVVCRGDSKNMAYYDSEGLKTVMKWHTRAIKEHSGSQNLSKYGTTIFLSGVNSAGILPTRNWRDGVFERADKINADAYLPLTKEAHTCYHCPVACKRTTKYEDKRFNVESRFGGPEFETLASMGSLCGVSDLPAITKAHEICNRMGMDTISSGGVIAFAMECFEQGVLEPEEGRTVKFGDADGMLWLLEKMVKRDGLGNILCQGVKRAAELIGGEAKNFAFHVKGQEIPMHDPRGKTNVAFSYALSPTGADHIEAPHELAFNGPGVAMVSPLGIIEDVDPLAVDEKKTAQFRKLQMTFSLNNILGICNYISAPIFPLAYNKIVDIVTMITGWSTSLQELLLAAERSENMFRVFNNREGFTIEDDRLFTRLHQPMASGPLKGRYIDQKDFRKTLNLYYQLMGWDEKGRPTRAKLIDLDLDWLAD